MLSNWIESFSILYARIIQAIGVFEQSTWKNLHISLSESIVDKPEFYYGSKRMFDILKNSICNSICLFTNNLFYYLICLKTLQVSNIFESSQDE